VVPEAVHRKTLRSLLEPLVPLLDDPAVTEVLVNGPFEVFAERRGCLERSEARFESGSALDSALRSVAQYVGRPLDTEHPVLEGRLPDGSRVEVVIPPAAPEGPLLAIRRFSKDRLTMDRLVELGALTTDARELLARLVEAKQNIVVAGGTGSGKTSLLAALTSFVPDGERIVVIEDARELSLDGAHVVGLLACPGDARGRGRTSIRDLFRAALRLRPDRIVVGEIRGGEALDLVQAMTSGHGGCLSTLHATYPADTLRRLETMALMSGVEIPLFALRAQIASAVDIIVQTARLRDGRRAVTHITEVVGCDSSDGYELGELFALGPAVHGAPRRLEPTGARPRCRDAIVALGADVPGVMLGAVDRSEARR
jgi:pilus assembly protein CpaF